MCSSPSASSGPEKTHLQHQQFDPLFLNSRKEAWVILGVWVICLLWAVPYCYFNGYLENGVGFQPGELQTVWGIPSWIFWGIAAPWFLANIFTTWFCFCYMADDDIGQAHEGADIEEEIQGMHAAEREIGQ